MFSSQMKKISRQYASRLTLPDGKNHYHGSFGMLSNYCLQRAKPNLCHTTGNPTTFISSSPCQQLGVCPQVRFFHSTPSLKQRESPYEDQIMNLLKKKPVDFQKIKDLLADIEKETETVMNIHTFIKMVKACIGMKSHHAADAAEQFVFKWMMKFYEQDRLDNLRRGNIFGMAIQAWVSSQHSSSGKRAEILLDKMEDLARTGCLPFPIDSPKYNTVMKAYAIHGDVENTQAVFDRCTHAFKQGNENARPDVHTWSTLLDAWAKAKYPDADAWEVAEKIFAGMQKSHKDGILKDPPNTISYTAIIDTCAKSKQPQRAEFWFREMHEDYKNGNTSAQPNVMSYTAVINSCAKSKQPQRAEFWLREMYKDYKTGNESAQPNERSFSTVIDAWANSETEEGAERSEKILNDMIIYSKETELQVKPDTVSYNTVMIAYARIGLPRKAEAVMQRQYDDFKAGNKRAALDVQGFQAIIHGWAKAKEIISGERAELVLNRMVELHKQGILKERPNVYTYNAVINTWAMVGKPDKARQAFSRMLDDCKNGNRNAKPSSGSFRALLQAYSNAKLSNAGELADDLLEEMKELKLTPDVGTLVSVKRCWECSIDPVAPNRVKELQATMDMLKARLKK